MGMNDHAIAIWASECRAYAQRCALLKAAIEQIETADAYERTARYHQAEHMRDKALFNLEKIGLRNLMVNPDA